MDPDAALQRIRDALADNDAEEAGYAAGDLLEWVSRGGFPPSDPAWEQTTRQAAERWCLA
jgi:hypothetical protein